jgi:hypothetical protein
LRLRPASQIRHANPLPQFAAPIRDGMRRPVPHTGRFKIPIDALDKVQKETGL